MTTALVGVEAEEVVTVVELEVEEDSALLLDTCSDTSVVAMIVGNSMKRKIRPETELRKLLGEEQHDSFMARGHVQEYSRNYSRKEHIPMRAYGGLVRDPDGGQNVRTRGAVVTFLLVWTSPHTLFYVYHY
jgi:hypothetical protein